MQKLPLKQKIKPRKPKVTSVKKLYKLIKTK